MSGTIQFSTPMAYATDRSSSRYALGGTFVTPQGDAIATDGRIMAITRVTAANLDKTVILPAELGPKTSTDTSRAQYDVNCKAITRNVPGKPAATADCLAGRFPRAFDCLPSAVGDYTVLAINAELLHNLAKAINASGDDAIVKLLIPPADKNGAVGRAVCAVSGNGTQGIGIIMPVAVDSRNDNAAAELAASFEDRREELAYLNDAIASHNNPPAPAATAAA